MQGLLDGTYKRFGGVIRETATGRIVRHLAESPDLTKEFMLDGGRGFLDGMRPFATMGQFQSMQNTLSSVLQVSQIAAGASVLNLGVSIAGFAYMGYKLHKLQKAIDTLHQSMQAGFNRIDERLDHLSEQLAYLHLLVEDSRQEQQRLSRKVTELHQLTLIQEIAALQAELIDRDRYPDASVRDALKVASRVRLVLSNQAVQALPKLNAETMLVADVAIQGWAVATAVEAHLLLETGRTLDACKLLEREVPRFRHLAQNWADAIISAEPPQLATAYRFATPQFSSYVSGDRVERIVSISTQDASLSFEQARRKRKDAELEFEMSQGKSLDQQWLHRQLAAAEYLDMLSELSARLEGVKAFAEFCDRNGVQSSCDVLPSTDMDAGFYIIGSQPLLMLN
ncbi:hypothetical protein NIES2104_62430 [Leptolyngbya sp. NIES-2104]|nr:hypothetical protein NIES2104_62430 [Leptolyngbya sp. NIES-2104]